MKITSRIEHKVALIDEHRTVLEAATLMTEQYIGSVVVTGATGIRGIFTERDLMMKVVGERKDPSQVKLADVMPEDSVKVSPNETCERCLELMKENRCRHLLVFNGDEFIGLVSLRDMVALMTDEKEEMISRLKEYITS
ncbi:MAG: CBS domain-containing protein [Mariprofundaceae bacterium]